MAASVSVPVPVPVPGRCGFYLDRKKRFCKMIVGSGNVFCGEHADAEEGNTKRRIPCPLDPKHTVFEDCLAKHLKKCNSREKPKPVYYVEDINAGSGDEAVEEYQVPLVERSKAELDLHLEKLKLAVRGLNLQLEERSLSHPALHEALQDPQNGDSASKHLKQQASILGHMEALSLLGANRCFIEFGAGRGKLSHWIHEAMRAHEDYHFLLVERSSTRFKVDGKHQQVDAEFERLQVDIQHLDLSKVPLLEEKDVPVVGVGKHLCGTATDLALRCLFERSTNHHARPPCKRPKFTDRPEDPAASACGSAVSGLALALCCHHRCVWRSYVGKAFFSQRGLGAAEFSAFQRMSSWATCGQRGAPSQPDEAEHQTEHGAEHGPEVDSLQGVLSAEERRRVGRQCKLLIDLGRVHYLKQKGFDARLTCYTSKQVTLENVLLTAIPSVTK